MDRWLQLVLLMPEDEFVTYKVLAEELGVSVRTVYDDITRLNQMMRTHGAQLVAKPHRGVTLDVTERSRFLSFLDSLENGGAMLGDTAEARIGKITRELLQSDTAYKSDDLCEALHISRSTLKKDLKGVRALIAPYDLRLVYQPYAGMRITGQEKDLRRLLVRLNRNVIASDGDFLRADIQKVATLLQDIFKQYMYRMAAYSFQNFVLHVDVAITRIRQGREIAPGSFPAIQHTPDVLALAKAVAVALEAMYDIRFSEGEQQYILLHLECKKVISWKQASTATADVYALIHQMLASVQNVFCYDFSHDFELIASLSTHLVPLRTRLLCGMPQENPMMKEIREGGPLAYEMANVACGVLQKEYGREISADETGYIAMYFHVALERMRAQRKKNVLIVCGTGKGAAVLLAHNIEQNYGKYLSVIAAYESTDFSDADLQGADYILSTIPIKEELPVPIIELGHAFPWNEGSDIRDHLKRDRQRAIMEYFSEEFLLPHMAAQDKDEVLKMMCEATMRAAQLPDTFYECVLERERIGGTALGNLVATPHPARPLGLRSLVMIGILERPIRWDEEEVQIVFLLSMKDGGDRNLPLFYKMISRFLMNKTLVRRLIKNQTFAEMFSIFSMLSDDASRLD